MVVGVSLRGGAIMMGLGMGAQTPLKWHLEYRLQYLDGCGGVVEGRGHHDGARNGGGAQTPLKWHLE